MLLRVPHAVWRGEGIEIAGDRGDADIARCHLDASAEGIAATRSWKSARGRGVDIASLDRHHAQLAARGATQPPRSVEIRTVERGRHG
jgi:hypothetical protein